MSGPKHTPGPWKVLSQDLPDMRVVVTCDMPPRLVTTAAFAEDARLIAAAPRLAEALKRVKEWNAEMHRANDPSLVPCLTSDLYNDWRELMTEVRAALREAEGS